MPLLSSCCLEPISVLQIHWSLSLLSMSSCIGDRLLCQEGECCTFASPGFELDMISAYEWSDWKGVLGRCFNIIFIAWDAVSTSVRHLSGGIAPDFHPSRVLDAAPLTGQLRAVLHTLPRYSACLPTHYANVLLASRRKVSNLF